MTQCTAVGMLTVGGRDLAPLRCGLEAGHEVARYTELADIARERDPIPGTPHRAILEWSDDAIMMHDWPEALDPDEPFDVEVPVPGEVRRAERDAKRPEPCECFDSSLGKVTAYCPLHRPS